MQAYRAAKVWKQMNRVNITVARCTVERLMKQQGLRGVIRGKRVRTTIPDPAAARPLDRFNRQFRAERPNQLWVSDSTYVSTWQGWLYVAFVIDVFARRIDAHEAETQAEQRDSLPLVPTIGDGTFISVHSVLLYVFESAVRERISLG
jgi:putative transposase